MASEPSKSRWVVVRWGALLAVLGGVLFWPHLTRRIDEEIRARVEERFAKHYANLAVSVRSAQIVEGEGIRVRGLTIRTPGVDGPSGELAVCEEMLLNCPTAWLELTKAELPIQRITIRRLLVRATRQPDGSWSAARLWPLPKFSERCADAIILENASVEVIDPERNPGGRFTLKDIQLTLSPADGARETLASERTMEVKGSVSAEHVQRAEVHGLLLPHGTGWQCEGQVQGIDVGPELGQTWPTELASAATALDSVRGEGEITFRAQFRPDQSPALQFQAAGELTRGRIEDPRLPYPLTDLRAVVHADQQGITLDELTASNGQTSLRLSGQRFGYQPSSALRLAGQVRNFALDRHRLDSLPDNLRAAWKKFQPAGELDADFQLAFDGERWRPQATVRCLDLSFLYDRFPYRLERATGTLDWQNDLLTMHLTAFGGGQPLRLDGEFTNPGPNFTGWFEAQGQDLPFDENLFAAIPEKPREVIRSLNPRGTFDVRLRSWRDDPTVQAMHHQMSVVLNRCSMRYDKFPYPLSNIRGTLQMRDMEWSFRDLEGTNDTGVVKCSGEIKQTPEGFELNVRLVGTQMPFEEELRDAFKPEQQKLWNEIKPQGAFNGVADLRYLPSQKKFDLALEGEPFGDSVSIEPVFFPYKLENVKGHFTYRDGHVAFHNVRGTHGRVNVAAQGEADVRPDGEWRFRLDNVAVDRLRVDRDVMAALPAKLRKIVSQMNPTGPINLRGGLELTGGGRPGVPVQSSWDMEFDLLQGTIECGIHLDNVFGGVRLIGTCDGEHTRCRGELSVDSLTYKDFQFTEVVGPLWIDDERILLGGGAERNAAGQPSRRVTAKSYGATLAGDCAVALGPTPRYSLRAVIADGDLQRFVKEAVSGRQKLSAKVFGHIELAGTGEGIHTLRGQGQLQLRDADIYELPLIISLLKILSVRAPDKTAFISSEMDFRLEADHVYFDRLEFSGDAISLVGKGEMNLNTDIRLTFHSVMGRSDYQLPIFKNVLGTASQQFMEIHVDGTLANPRTRTEAFPAVNEALQQLQPERARANNPR